MKKHAEEFYEQWPSAIRELKEQSPDIAVGFGTMFQRLMKDGALSNREKELIALGIGMALRCEPCLLSHVQKAIKAGATREQILEVAGVVVTMQGGPGYVYVPKMIAALDALGVEPAMADA